MADTFGLLPHSCRYCEKIVIDGTGPEVNQSFEFSFRQVRKFARHCAFFEQTLKPLDTSLGTAHRLAIYIWVDSEDIAFLNVDWKNVNGNSISETELHIFSGKDDCAARYITSRPLARSPADPAHLELCLQYYKDCLTHKKCKIAMERNQSHEGPTRLLDIRPNSQARLYTIPLGETPVYAALSYCWGNSDEQKKAKTTRVNVHERHHGIEITHLPKSIRDAVEVTRSLEISYLWVDALCIIQDDDMDRSSEISKMASVYRRSTITIAAARAKDSKEGFLGNRDLKKAYGSLFQLPYCNTSAGVSTGSMLLSEQPIADTYQEHIDARAWTMQEDIISLRLLRFGSKQTTWRCLEHCTTVRVDGGGDPTLVNKDFNFCVGSPYRVAEVQSNISNDRAFGVACAMESWSDWVSQYTNRRLSNPNDRLPACAALAENFANIMGFSTDDYLAGLWNIDPCIFAQLLWYRPEETKSERSSGPTWSWISIKGPIAFFPRWLLQHGFVVKAEAKYVNSSIEYQCDNCGCADNTRIDGVTCLNSLYELFRVSNTCRNRTVKLQMQHKKE